MHNRIVNIFLVLIHYLAISRYREQVDPPIFERIHEPFAMHVYSFVISVLLLDPFTEIHYISVGERISKSEEDFIRKCTTITLVEAVAEINAKPIMKILQSVNEIMS